MISCCSICAGTFGCVVNVEWHMDEKTALSTIFKSEKATGRQGDFLFERFSFLHEFLHYIRSFFHGERRGDHAVYGMRTQQGVHFV